MYVLHQTNCMNCKSFIANEFHTLREKHPKLTMVKVNMDKPGDIADLRRIIKVSPNPKFPVIVFSDKGFFKHKETPTMQSIHESINEMTQGVSKVHRMSLKELHNLLESDGHKRQLTPLGSSVNIAMDHQYNNNLVSLEQVFGDTSVVLFKRDNCGWCQKLKPEYEKLVKHARVNPNLFSRRVGFYTVDTMSPDHFNASASLITKLSKLHKIPDELIAYTKNGGVPRLALFTGHSYPHMLAGRQAKDLLKEIEKNLNNVCVNIQDTNDRQPFEKVAVDKDSVVLFIDWRHMPCLKAINTLHAISQELDTASTTNKPKYYVFNVRNNADAWAAFCNNYKVDYNVKLAIDSIPQIIFFFGNNRVPKLKAHVDRLTGDALKAEIARQYHLKGVSISISEPNLQIPHYRKSQLSEFSGGIRGGSSIAKMSQTLHQLTKQINEMTTKLSEMNSHLKQLNK